MKDLAKGEWVVVTFDSKQDNSALCRQGSKSSVIPVQANMRAAFATFSCGDKIAVILETRGESRFIVMARKVIKMNLLFAGIQLLSEGLAKVDLIDASESETLVLDVKDPDCMRRLQVLQLKDRVTAELIRYNVERSQGRLFGFQTLRR